MLSGKTAQILFILCFSNIFGVFKLVNHNVTQLGFFAGIWKQRRGLEMAFDSVMFVMDRGITLTA